MITASLVHQYAYLTTVAYLSSEPNGDQEKVVRRLDPVWDTLDGRRARLLRVVDATTLELADNDGKALPDYRHISQVWAY
jgi:hypothetical protein